MEVYFEGQLGKSKEDQMELINVWFPLILVMIIFNFIIRLLIRYKFKSMTRRFENTLVCVGLLLILYFYVCYVCYT